MVSKSSYIGLTKALSPLAPSRPRQPLHLDRIDVWPYSRAHISTPDARLLRGFATGPDGLEATPDPRAAAIRPFDQARGKPMSKTNFRPLHDRIVVKRIVAEEKTKGGIIIPDSAKEKPSEGLVIA